PPTRRASVLREPLFFPGLCGTFLRFYRKRVGIVAGEAVFGGDDVGRDALRHEVGLHGEARVNRDRRAVRAHGDPTHHLDAAGDVRAARAAPDLVRGEVHRLHAGGAEAVDGEAGNALVEVGEQDGRAREAAALFAHLRDVAPDHVLDRVAVEVVPFLHRVQNPGR